VNSIKKDKTKLYLIFEKQRESKSIDKQIDRLIRGQLQRQIEGRFRKAKAMAASKSNDTPRSSSKAAKA
jgi:hypothetical protein